MSSDDLTKPEIRQEPDGRWSIRRRNPINYPMQVPNDLLQQPPQWAKSLIERGTTFAELVSEVGRRSESPAEHHNVLRVVEQLAQTEQGRQTIDRVLSPGFIHSLKTVIPQKPPLWFIPAIKVYQNANAPGIEAWISPFEDEEVWPVAFLQAVQLDQAISAVWESNLRTFVELFLFDGTDLQGRLARFVRVYTDENQLEIVLDAPTLAGQARSLLGSSRSIPDRRFSAFEQLIVAVELTFAQWLSQSGVSQFGTASLVTLPQFSWDGYHIWLNSDPNNIPPTPKTAALRIHLVIRIDDVLYGSTTASGDFDTMLQRTGGANPIVWTEGFSTGDVPQPWGGDVPDNVRWAYYFIDILSDQLTNVVAQQVGLLAGPSPGSVRILPGRSAQVPTPPSTSWGLIEIGRTDDDSTIVLSP
jgi:hypothetical protein